MNSSTEAKMETMNSTAATDFDHSEPIPNGLALFVVIFSVISVLAGTFGNARVCFLLRRRQDLRKVPHYLLANLAVVGIFAAVLSITFVDNYDNGQLLSNSSWTASRNTV